MDDNAQYYWTTTAGAADDASRSPRHYLYTHGIMRTLHGGGAYGSSFRHSREVRQVEPYLARDGGHERRGRLAAQPDAVEHLHTGDEGVTSRQRAHIMHTEGVAHLRARDSRNETLAHERAELSVHLG